MSWMVTRRAAALFALLFALAGRAAFSQSAPPAAGAAYTEEQAGRGAATFGKVCIECHARKDISDAEFKGKWNGRSAFDFFDRIRSTMPESDPGSLGRAAYLDLTAYMLQLNGTAAGTAPLPDDDAALKAQPLKWSSATK